MNPSMSSARPAEDTEGFIWFIRQFVECMGVSPRLWACHQNFAIFSAIRTVVSDALVILDDWHLNQNQKKNTATYMNARGNHFISQRMTDDLHRLRCSNNEMEFLTRQSAFEALYFTESAPPRWYSTLYQFNPELVVKCFNLTTCGPRFFFQGSGYSDSANSAYQRVIMRREIRMACIPSEMQGYCKRMRLERQVKERSESFKDRPYLLVVKQYDYDEEVWGRIVPDILPTRLEHFFSKSVENAPQYCLRGRQHIEEQRLGPCIEFSVCSSDSQRVDEVRIHRVPCPFSLPKRPFLEGLCSCSWTASTGIPCRHAVRVALTFQGDGVLGVSRFPLHAMLHPYWRKDRDGWQEEDIMRHRDGDIAIEGTDREVGNEDNSGREQEDESTRKALSDRLSARFFCNGRAAWNKVHLCIGSKGVLAIQKMDRMMRLLAREVNRNTETGDIDIVKVVTSVAASLEAEEGSGMQPRDVSLEEAAAMWIRNTNQGKVKGRGTKKRKRSWTEGASKKRQR